MKSIYTERTSLGTALTFLYYTILVFKLTISVKVVVGELSNVQLYISILSGKICGVKADCNTCPANHEGLCIDFVCHCSDTDDHTYG